MKVAYLAIELPCNYWLIQIHVGVISAPVAEWFPLTSLTLTTLCRLIANTPLMFGPFRVTTSICLSGVCGHSLSEEDPTPSEPLSRSLSCLS